MRIKMKNRDKFITILFLLFILVIPAVTIVRGFLPQETQGLTAEEQQAILEGNGTLQQGGTAQSEDTQAETPKVKEPFFTTLQNSINEFTNGLFLRTKLIKYNTDLTALFTGGAYIESTQVLLGKEGYLFYKTEIDGKPLHDYMGINLYSDEDLAKIAANLTQMRDYFAEEGIEFYVTGIPNKEIVYERYMPDTIVKPGKISKSEQVANYIWENTDLTYVYPKEELIEASYEYPVYYSSDTHWNQIGAFIGFQEIYEAAYGKREEIEDDTFILADSMYKGDLASIAGVADKYQDPIYTFNAESVDESMKREGTVVVIGDSFSGFLSTIAKGYWTDMQWISINVTPFTLETILGYQPDVIIYECVERYHDTLRDFSLLNK